MVEFIDETTVLISETTTPETGNEAEKKSFASLHHSRTSKP